VWANEEEIKKLEELEKRQVEKLQMTMAWEQQQTFKFRQSV
jgi:hypothetical protein